MASSGSAVQFSRAEVARVLSLPKAVVHALIANGVLECDDDSVSATGIESFFRDGLLCLYRAIAEQAIDAEKVARQRPLQGDDPESARAEREEDPLITRSIVEYGPPESASKRELRIAPRYVPRRELAGTFRGVDFTLLQISTTGMRIRHTETFHPGDEANLTFAIPRRRGRTFVLRARVVWTSIAQRGDEPSFCVSGLRVTENFDQLRQAIQFLRQDGNLDAEGDMLSQAPDGSPADLTGLADEDVAAIIRAVRKFTSDPTEASRWYARARFSVTEEAVRDAVPHRPRDREEILGLWEYLDRKIDLKAIAGVVAWIRRSRSAAAV
jgi:hypothetical protein